MAHSGRVAFGAMEAVVFGKPAAETIAEEARRLDAERVFLMVSGTLNRTPTRSQGTSRIGDRSRASSTRCRRIPPGCGDRGGRGGTPAGADLIATIGGGSVTDGAKAVQLCLANNIRTPEALDDLRPVKVRRRPRPTSLQCPRDPADLGADNVSAGEFSAIAGVTDERSG